MSPANKFQTLALKEMRTKRKKTSVEAGTQTKEFEYFFSSLNIHQKLFDRWEFEQNEKKVKFYTGLLSFDILHKYVFEHVFLFVAYKSQNLTPCISRVYHDFDKT